MRRSGNTLIGRVYERVRLEAEQDVEALYGFVDPAIRARRQESRDDGAEPLRSAIRASVNEVRSATVEQVEIVAARKVCALHGGRPAALVRSIIRYNDSPELSESRTIWVRDEGAWYSTAPS